MAAHYQLFAQMLSYGIAKVLKLQFAAIGPIGLLRTYGEDSPMRLLWAFMGHSRPYNWFIGLSEVVGGVLLLFRRTTTLGALLLIAVMTNVVMLNLCYDVPVKLHASHLLIAAIVVAL